MIPIVTLWAALLGALTSVEALSVQPAGDRTEVVIEVAEPVAYDHFLLRDPARLVVDISGAQNALPRDRFEGIDRGGVRSLRVSQYRPQVVRVVVDLREEVRYTVTREEGRIRISFPNPESEFAAWYSGPSRLSKSLPARDEAPAAAPRRSEPAVSASPAPVRVTQPRITLYFKDTPISEVLATFAEFSGRSIVAGEGVTARITADIRNQPWDVALEAVLQSYGYAALEQESGIIRVDKVENLREREKVEELITRPFTIRYVSADSILPAIKGLLSDRGSVTRNSATNALVVTDARSIVEDRVAPMIEQLDVRTPQVTISAKIIFIDRNELEALGVTYDLKDSRGNQLNQVIPGGIDSDGDGIISGGERTNNTVVRLGGASIAALANANERIDKPSLQILGTLVLGRHSLLSFIDALSQVSISEMHAQPTISTQDHREAYVQVGQETPVRVIDAGAQGGGGGTGGQQGAGGMPRATVEFKNTGIILRVTPHVTGNQVLLDLHAENSDVSIAPSDIGVYFNKQQARTQILLNNGETGVIGGLTVTTRSQTRTGIPVLMNLPVLGRLFRTTREDLRKQDLLIMVTPHIVRASD